MPKQGPNFAQFSAMLSFYTPRWQRPPHQVVQCFAIFGQTNNSPVFPSPLSILMEGLLIPGIGTNTQQGSRLFGLALIRLTTNCILACYDLALNGDQTGTVE